MFSLIWEMLMALCDEFTFPAALVNYQVVSPPKYQWENNDSRWILKIILRLGDLSSNSRDLGNLK